MKGLEVWVWENFTPVCDFYLCHFHLKSEEVILLSKFIECRERHHAFDREATTLV